MSGFSLLFFLFFCFFFFIFWNKKKELNTYLYQIITGCQSRNINWNRELTAKCINRWQMHRNHLVKHIFYEPSSIVFYALLFFFSFCISFCIFFFTFLLLTFFFNSLLGIPLVITELMPLSGHNYLTVNCSSF